MGFLRRSSSRRVLAVATAGLFAAGLGGACAAQDDRGGMTQAGYGGHYLDWSGKKAAPPPSPAQDDAADLAEARFAPNADYTPGGAAPRTPRAEPANFAPSRYEAASDDAPTSRFGPPSSDDAPPSRYGPVAGQSADDAPAQRYAAPPAADNYSSEAYYPPPRAPAEASHGPAQPTAPARYARPADETAASQAAPPGDATAAGQPASRIAASHPVDAGAGEAADGMTQAQAEAPALFPPSSPPASAPAMRAPSTPTPIFRHGPRAAQAEAAPATSAVTQASAPSPSTASYAPAPSAAPARAEGGSSVRFYSLHREYGMTPDAIPEPTEGHTVLIGPPDAGPAADKPDQADQDQGGVGAGDKPAAPAKPDAAASGDK